MKSVMLAVVGVFVLAGVASATDHHRQNVRVVEKVVVERHVKAPIVERVVEYKEVPRVQIVERVVVDDHYGHRQNVVERVVVREKVQRNVQRVEVQKVRNVQRVEVQKSRSSSRRGVAGRLFGR